MRRIADRDNPCHCPDCGTQGSRVITAPSLALVESASRSAHATNERAANVPRQSADDPPRGHGAGCRCCAGGKVTLAGAETPRRLKRPEGRPWMISH
nr:zinc ribbon domain-containing protein [Pandoraea faecigallinarum]